MQLNFKHLRYFWTVAKLGSVARAAEQLNLAPHSVSGQLVEFESSLGSKLFQRIGRRNELTEIGKMVQSYADEIFAVGEELVANLAAPHQHLRQRFRIGIADSVSKLVAYQLLRPIMKLDNAPQLSCTEGRIATLLSALSVHQLDLVIADRNLPSQFKVRGYSKLLGESGSSFFASRTLAKSLKGKFPSCLHQAPFLLPGEDFAMRARLLQWMERLRLQPLIVGEFDDGALMKEFGRSGSGVFTAPTAMKAHIEQRYEVKEIGQVDSIPHQVFAISTERRSTHPAVIAIEEVAKQEIFLTRS